jgi:hypothetical protein
VHTQTTADQFVSVAYTQGGVTTPVPLASVTCDASYYTIGGIVAANNSSDLTLTLKLKGPDGFEGPEITCTIASADIITDRPNVSWTNGNAYRIGVENGFYINGSGPYATGTWVSNVAYAVWLSFWEGWYVLYFSFGTVKTGWHPKDPGYVPTVASIMAEVSPNPRPWTGKLLTDIPWEPVAVTSACPANVSFVDDGPKKIVGNSVIVGRPDSPDYIAEGTWLDSSHYAAFVSRWGNTLVVRFDSSGTGKSNWQVGLGASYVPTVANIDALLLVNNGNLHSFASWTGNLPVLPFGHTLVVGSPVELYFEFNGMPSGITSAASFAVTLNGTTALPLASASLVGTRLMLPYTALDAVEHVFTLVALGQSHQFVVPASAVFTFPTVGTTTMSPPYVTLGASVQLTTTFASAFPASATATTVVTPEGKAATLPLATTLSGPSAVVSHNVLFDSLHAGAITVTYGPASKLYSWAALSSPLTAGSIYTFPSSFTVDGSANGLAPYSLKAGVAGALQLAFVGGDGLHSASAAAQVSSVTYKQGTTTTPVAVGSLVCALPGNMTVSAVTPADTKALTLTVKLKGPDGAPMSGVMSANVDFAQIAAPAGSADIWFFDGTNNFRIVGNQLFHASTTLMGTGVWVSRFAHATRVAMWNNGWLVAQFSESTVQSKFISDAAFAPTEASVLAQTSGRIAWLWTGVLSPPPAAPV